MTIRIHNKVAAQPGSASDELVTKGQLDTGVADAKNRANHTGTQTSSTISDFQTAVESVISAYLELGATPETLNTLNELAAALGDDPNFATTVSNYIADLDTRIDALEAGAGAARTYSALVGDGAASSFDVMHGWSLADKNKVLVEVVEVASGESVLVKINRIDTETVRVDFGTYAPTMNEFRVLLSEVIG